MQLCERSCSKVVFAGVCLVQPVLGGCWFCDTSLVLLSVAMESFQQPLMLGISGDSSGLASEHQILQFSQRGDSVPPHVVIRYLFHSGTCCHRRCQQSAPAGEGGLQKAPSQHELSEPYFPFRHYSTPQWAKCILHFKAASCGSGLIQECSANLHAAIFHCFILHFQTLLTKINPALWLHRHNAVESVWNRINVCRPPLSLHCDTVTSTIRLS